MARTPGKKGAKSNTQAVPAKAGTTQAATYPEEFTQVPTALRPFAATLPTSHVYAVHIDRSPVKLKRRVYVIPVLMNLAITAFLMWRIYYAAPTYLEQVITIFGYETAWKVEPSQMGVADIFGTVSNRTFLLFFDYALFALLGSWPWEFMFGSKYSRHTGAFEWRRSLGFKETEIVVRKGRKWDEALLDKVKDATKWEPSEELTLRIKIEPALRQSYTSKTGYLLLDKEWDLDFRGMIDAHKLVEKGTVKLDDLDHIVLLHTQKQWLMWRAHNKEADAKTAALAAETAEEDATLVKFRNKLEDLGCEDVFFRWIEIIQYESSLTSGFTEVKQKEALRELERLLADRKVDYTAFLIGIGGRNGVPGLNNSSKPSSSTA